ncbi:MAG: adenylosuccinate synthase, partial [Sphingobacteriales bacterium]
INVIGNGVVLDPVVLKKEIEAINKLGVDVASNLLISKKAQLILPTHKLIDKVSEEALGTSKIGSTLKGIGPTYQDKIGRTGLRIGDILAADFKDRYNTAIDRHKKVFELYGAEVDYKEAEDAFLDALDFVRTLKLVDTEYYLNEAIKDGKKILAEGAQGSLLDVDFGTYPFVTSSTTLVAGACTGLGIAPRHIGKVFGIFKAYATRVGSGPFPTELTDAVGDQLRKAGNEFGSTTGRPRRCGWLDLPALKYAIMLNGVTELHMMKADVLDDFDEINACTHYKEASGEVTSYFPFDVANQDVEPQLKPFAGWKTPLQEVVASRTLPENFNSYISYLENELELPISIISVGPGRNHTLIR